METQSPLQFLFGALRRILNIVETTSRPLQEHKTVFCRDAEHFLARKVSRIKRGSEARD